MRGPLVMVVTALVAGGLWWSLSSTSALQGGLEPEPMPAASAALPPAPTPAAAQPAPRPASNQDAAQLAALPTVQVYKSPTCGCCNDWIRHLEENGFTVEAINTGDMMTVKAALGLPSDLGSCHTAVIADFVIEGHVPADDIKRFIAEAPEARGLAVPGMPVGSPGMEVPGQPADPFAVIAFDADGARRVYRSY